MAYQLTPLVALNAVLFVLTASAAVYGALRYVRDDRRLSVLAFAILMVSLSVRNLNRLLIGMVTSEELKLLAYNVFNTITVPAYVFSLLIFALVFCGHRRWIAWAGVLAALTVAGLGGTLVLDPEFLYESRGLVTRGPVTIPGFTFEEFVQLDREFTRPFLAYTLYSYAIILTSAGILARYILARSENLSTEQPLLIGVGIATPIVLNGVRFFDVVPPALSVTDIGFGVTAVCFTIAILQYQLFELPPISRQQLVGTIADPLVFVDDENEVAYSNPTAREVFDVGSRWRGMTATEFFGPHAERIGPFAGDDQTADSTVELDDRDRYFDVNSTTVRTPAGNTEGRTITLRDVTELHRTNQRLDQFASMVSHDLRTPLNRAVVQTNRLARDGSDGQTDALLEALEQMESRIDDMLQLARAGESVETADECSLGDLVEEVWATVETDGARLDCRVGDTTVEADPVRLFQVVENLLRNAVDHNDPPLTVRVGTFGERTDLEDTPTPAGFFVEDDGDGIPEDGRCEIFDHGYTTSRRGNGYGLSIVRSIVEAHGWEIRVAEGPDGGARFEIVGIEAG